MKTIIFSIVFVLTLSIANCQQQNNFTKSNYYLVEDTLHANEGQSGDVIEKGIKIGDKKNGLWIGMHANQKKLSSAVIYTGNETNEKSIEKPFFGYPVLSLLNYDVGNQKSLLITDPDFNFFYKYDMDSLGRLLCKLYSNMDSTIALCYDIDGFLTSYSNYNFHNKVEMQYNYDKNGKLTDSFISRNNGPQERLKENEPFFSKGKYKNNLKSGIWKYYKDSKIVKIEKFKNGILLRKTLFY